jgi:hypothetical protein
MEEVQGECAESIDGHCQAGSPIKYNADSMEKVIGCGCRGGGYRG